MTISTSLRSDISSPFENGAELYVTRCSCKTTKFLHEMKLKVVDWPAQNPDLNPLENLWAIVKQRVYNFPTPPKNKDELWACVQEVWYSITLEECHKLVASVPERIQAVIKSKGGYTQY